MPQQRPEKLQTRLSGVLKAMAVAYGPVSWALMSSAPLNCAFDACAWLLIFSAYLLFPLFNQTQYVHLDFSCASLLLLCSFVCHVVVVPNGAGVSNMEVACGGEQCSGCGSRHAVVSYSLVGRVVVVVVELGGPAFVVVECE